MRQMLTVFALSLGLALPGALGAHGDQVHGEEWALEKPDNHLAAGAPEDEFESFVAKDVEGLFWQLNWTTAACVQMVANYQDLYIDQQAIMKQMFGKAEDEAKSFRKMRRAIDDYQPVNNKNETKRHLHARKFKVAEKTIVDKLRKRGPVVVWLEDVKTSREPHAMVLLQVWFQYDYFGKEVPKRVVLYDPWPDPIELRKEMSWYDFKHAVLDSVRLEVHER